MTRTSPGVVHPTPGAPFARALSRALLCAGLACALAGCHHGLLKGRACDKPKAYASAQNEPPLRIPPGIDHPDTHGALKIPELNEPAPPPRRPQDPCLDQPPSFTVPSQTPTRRVPSG